MTDWYILISKYKRDSTGRKLEQLLSEKNYGCKCKQVNFVKNCSVIMNRIFLVFLILRLSAGFAEEYYDEYEMEVYEGITSLECVWTNK